MNVLDLFSGIGGFSLGLERAGMRTVAFCEIEPYPRAVLRKHWPDVPIYEDVRAVTADRLRADGIDRIDVICGGFPCQDISLAGKGAGLAGERSGLWFEFHRLIDEIKPRYAIIENVSALRSRGLDAVLGSLAAIGYDAEWHCIPASAVGAPHQRDRIWIIAYPNTDGARSQGRYSEVMRERAGERIAGAVGSPASNDLADAGCRRHSGSSARQVQQPRGAICTGEDVADADCQRQPQQGWPESNIGRRLGGLIKEVGKQWLVEPDVGRVANGVPARVDRLRALGNAVVPQIPEIIGRAIMSAEGEGRAIQKQA